MERIGGYELVSLIGVGMSGTVWRARSPGPVSRTVALKRAVPTGGDDHRASRERLRLEATLLADLDHPHIVDLLDVLDDGDGVAIVMPLARGGSLRALLDERRALPAGQVVALLALVADALASAHRRGLVHGDVKPANVLLTEDGEPLLADFGAARHLCPAPAPGAPVAGTAPYLDPDVLAGDSPDARTDVYALGVICFESLTGALPFDGRIRQALDAVGRGVNDGSLADARSVPEPLAELVERAVSQRAHDRPVDMEHFASELRAAVDPTSIQLPGAPSAGARPVDPARGREGRHETRLFGPRPPALVPAVRPPGHRRLITFFGLLGLLGLLAVVLAGALWRERHHHQATKAGATADRTDATDACASYPRLAAPSGTKRFDVDLTGDGCRVPVTWDGHVLSARFGPQERSPRYYEIGLPGDALVFGDWDCDGAETPALYRPRTGEVIYVNSFGAQVGDRSRAERIDRLTPRGTPRVAAAQHGCQAVVIDR